MGLRTGNFDFKIAGVSTQELGAGRGVPPGREAPKYYSLA